MRRCLFCANLAGSHEDVWPRWLTKRFVGTRPSEMTATVRGTIRRPWRQLRPELRVRCVCATCNNGWMSRLEHETQQIVEPMLSGETTALTPNAQRTLLAWACKTAMVLEAVEKPALHVYTVHDRVRMRECREIPDRTSGWLAYSSEQSLLMSEKTEHSDAEIDASASALATTLVFGHFALQVFTIKVSPPVATGIAISVDILKGPWYESLIQISALPDAVVRWPPLRALLGEEELWHFSGRFRSAAGDHASRVALTL